MCRIWNDIDIDSFRQDISYFQMLAYKRDLISDLVSCYNKAMTQLLDKHAPLRKRPITVHPQAEWYTSDLELEKRKRRTLEQSLSHLMHKIYWAFLPFYSELLVKTHQQFCITKVEDISGDQRYLLKIINELLHNEYEQQLTASDKLNDLVNRLAIFFRDKILKIHLDLASCQASSHSTTESSSVTYSLSDFHPLSEVDGEKIIKRSSSKCFTADIVKTIL